MIKPEILTIKCYRQERDDVDWVRDVTVPGDFMEKAKESTKVRLLSHFRDKYRRSKPHTADLIGEDGRLIARFKVRRSHRDGDIVEEVIPMPRQPKDESAPT